MRIIGIDPGLGVTGIGVIEASGNACTYLHHGTVRTKASEPVAVRLMAIHLAVREAAEEWKAETGAVEAGFVGDNAKTALALGQARAATILGLAGAGLEVAEYSPSEVKQTVVGYGRGDKAQVAEMVRMQLGMAEIVKPADASDALAVAITHWALGRFAP